MLDRPQTSSRKAERQNIYHLAIAAFAFIGASLAAQASAVGADSGATSDLVPSSLIQIPSSSNFYSPYAFVVDKKSRQLSVWQQTNQGLKQVASFPADMGKSEGDKRSQGDHKTPEGIYYLLERRDADSLDFNLYGQRAFTTDYPNFFDRLEGKTGNGIWLHAVPDHVPLTRGSRGCVVVRNNVILDLTPYVKLGRTPILIQNTLEMVPSKELAKTNAQINQWLEDWRSSWEAKDIDRYIEHYASDFKSMRMNKSQWRAYKSRLAEAYKTIKIRISKPTVFFDRNRAIVRFIQEYSSDRHTDIGEKVLYIKKDEKSFRIIGELWAEESSSVARQEVESSRGTTTLSCVDDKKLSCTQANASTSIRQ